MQLEDGAQAYFDDVVAKDKIEINMDVPLELETLSEYVEG